MVMAPAARMIRVVPSADARVPGCWQSIQYAAAICMRLRGGHACFLYDQNRKLVHQAPGRRSAFREERCGAIGRDTGSKALAPGRWSNDIDADEYQRRYKAEVLDHLDSLQVMARLRVRAGPHSNVGVLRETGEGGMVSPGNGGSVAAQTHPPGRAGVRLRAPAVGSASIVTQALMARILLNVPSS